MISKNIAVSLWKGKIKRLHDQVMVDFLIATFLNIEQNRLVGIINMLQ